MRDSLDGRMPQTTDYFAQAFARARRRKSPWNLPLIPLVFGGWFVLWWAFFRLAWRVHELLYPEHAGKFAEFWPGGVSLGAFIPSFMMLFGLMVPALAIAMVAANAVLWLVPPARRALEAEARPFPGTDFRSAQRTLIRVAVWAMLLGAVVSLAGAATLHKLR
jgi:hypothetical protein